MSSGNASFGWRFSLLPTCSPSGKCKESVISSRPLPVVCFQAWQKSLRGCVELGIALSGDFCIGMVQPAEDLRGNERRLFHSRLLRARRPVRRLAADAFVCAVRVTMKIRKVCVARRFGRFPFTTCSLNSDSWLRSIRISKSFDRLDLALKQINWVINPIQSLKNDARFLINRQASIKLLHRDGAHNCSASLGLYHTH